MLFLDFSVTDDSHHYVSMSTYFVSRFKDFYSEWNQTLKKMSLVDTNIWKSIGNNEHINLRDVLVPCLG